MFRVYLDVVWLVVIVVAAFAAGYAVGAGKGWKR